MGRLLRHEKWLIFGQTVNELLYAELIKNSKEQQDVSLLIKQRNEQDRFWLNKVIQSAIEKNGGWLISKIILTRRFKSLIYKPFFKVILLFFLDVIAFLLNIMLALQLNFQLHSKGGLGYWVGSGGWGKSAKQAN